MKLKRAIVILEDLKTILPQFDPIMRREAVMLGSEALDYIIHQRLANPGVAFTILKDETEE